MEVYGHVNNTCEGMFLVGLVATILLFGVVIQRRLDSFLKRNSQRTINTIIRSQQVHTIFRNFPTGPQPVQNVKFRTSLCRIWQLYDF
jgi:hypothetical protein